jgi:hypothetical protein
MSHFFVAMFFMFVYVLYLHVLFVSGPILYVVTTHIQTVHVCACIICIGFYAGPKCCKTVFQGEKFSPVLWQVWLKSLTKIFLQVGSCMFVHVLHACVRIVCICMYCMYLSCICIYYSCSTKNTTRSESPKDRLGPLGVS